jgi:hypothetical protein
MPTNPRLQGSIFLEKRLRQKDLEFEASLGYKRSAIKVGEGGGGIMLERRLGRLSGCHKSMKT